MQDETRNLARTYESTTPHGEIVGKIGPRDLRRFEDIEPHLLADISSLLDVGCCSGDWLNFAVNHRRIQRHLGIDIAANRIAEAKRRFPHLSLEVATAEDLVSKEWSFDSVTCFEVLEHVPEWRDVFQSLFTVGRRQVLIAVPNNETIQYTPCVHCGKATPIYGHLHSFTGVSFPHVEGWTCRKSLLRDRGPIADWPHRIYQWLKPRWPWMIADYRKEFPSASTQPGE